MQSIMVRPRRFGSRRLGREVGRVIDNVAFALGRVTPLLLVTGFWRSGTTWFQQCLAEAFEAKTSFEPLAPGQLCPTSATDPLGLRDWDHMQAFLPYLDGEDKRYDAMWSYLDSVVAGYCSGRLGLQGRKGISDSLRKRLIIKCVRLQFSHTAFYRRFGLPVVHIRRHPCAVVASMRDVRWLWHFKNVDTMSLLYGIEDGREEHLTHCRTAILQSNENLVSRIAAYWAVGEAYAERSLLNVPQALVVNYEEAIKNPVQVVNRISERFGLGSPSSFDASADSPVTEPISVGQDINFRLSSWQRRLTKAEIDQIYSVVSAIFPDWCEKNHS
jgi:hypothetical protein